MQNNLKMADAYTTIVQVRIKNIYTYNPLKNYEILNLL